jgi:metal-sulfur cluster biosynthetic enzyme
MNTTALPDESALRDALRLVIDPELGMNIVELGLVYGIEVGEKDGVRVEMTMTSAACPVTDLLVEQVRSELAAVLPPGTPLEVELVWDPPWTPEKMSDLARAQFGWAPR